MIASAGPLATSPRCCGRACDFAAHVGALRGRCLGLPPMERSATLWTAPARFPGVGVCRRGLSAPGSQPWPASQQANPQLARVTRPPPKTTHISNG